MITLLSTLLLGGVTVTLPPEARVRGTELELGTIAVVEGEDPAEVARVSAISLGYAPAPGYSRLLSAQRLHFEIGRRLSGVDVVFSGSASTRVWPEVRGVDGSAIEASARAELGRHLKGLDATAELVSRIDPLEVPVGLKSFELQSVVAESEVRGGSVSVPVRILVDGSPYRSVWTTWNVKLFDRRPVLTRPVRMGESVGEGDVEWRRVAVQGRLDAPANQPLARASIVGAVASRDLATDHRLTLGDLVRPTLVKRGDTVFLEVRKNSVNARVAAVADQAGSRGDRIRVIVLSSERAMVATVLSRDLVRIDLSSER